MAWSGRKAASRRRRPAIRRSPEFLPDRFGRCDGRRAVSAVLPGLGPVLALDRASVRLRLHRSGALGRSLVLPLARGACRVAGRPPPVAAKFARRMLVSFRRPDPRRIHQSGVCGLAGAGNRRDRRAGAERLSHRASDRLVLPVVAGRARRPVARLRRRVLGLSRLGAAAGHFLASRSSAGPGC